jgi:hypothetical protein
VNWFSKFKLIFTFESQPDFFFPVRLCVIAETLDDLSGLFLFVVFGSQQHHFKRRGKEMSFDTSKTTTDFSKDGIKFLFSSEDSRFSRFFEGLSKRGEKIVVDLNLYRLLTFELSQADLEFYLTKNVHG